MPESQARPPAGCRKVRNPYRAARARGRARRKCWISSSSSTALPPDRSLHLVEHVGERRLELERLLDLVRADVRVFAIFDEARAMMVANELDKGGRIRLPILGEAFEVLEDRVHAVLREERHGILRVFVEVRVEDSLVHEVPVALDLEE